MTLCLGSRWSTHHPPRPVRQTPQTVVKKDLKKEEAEELKAKLEAVGAQIEIV